MRVAFSLTALVMSIAFRTDGSPRRSPASHRHLRGAIATKQSILSFRSLHGLLRGACHRARIRATRWLAMTLKYPPDTGKIAKSFSVYPNGDGATASLSPYSETITSTETGPMAKRQLKLGAFMRPVSIHTGAWRYPGA